MKLTIESIAAILQTRFKCNPNKVVPEATFDDLGLDSLSQIELGMLLEKKMGIKISEDELQQMSTISDIIAAANGAQQC
jgi:acyl carrier protein